MPFRKLSKTTIEKLEECLRIEQEENNEDHCMMKNMLYAVAPLYRRGLIKVRKIEVDNKTLDCIFLTEAGKEYLRNLKSNHQNIKVV